MNSIAMPRETKHSISTALLNVRGNSAEEAVSFHGRGVAEASFMNWFLNPRMKFQFLKRSSLLPFWLLTGSNVQQTIHGQVLRRILCRELPLLLSSLTWISYVISLCNHFPLLAEKMRSRVSRFVWRLKKAYEVNRVVRTTENLCFCYHVDSVSKVHIE